MSIKLFNNCVNELKLQLGEDEERNIEPIYNYIKSLKIFLYLIKNQTSFESEYILQEFSKIVKLKKVSKNEVIFQQGDIGEKFYIVLNGHFKKLVLRHYEYYMSEEEYILFLLQLRMNNQTEIIRQCNHYNSIIYSIPYDNFDTFVLDLSNKATKEGIYLDSEAIIEKSKEVYSKISQDKNTFINEKIYLSPEKYIEINKVSDNIIENTILINNYNKNKNGDISEEEINEIKSMMKTKRKLIIPCYEIFSDLKTGATFGEDGLEPEGKFRTSTIISIEEETYLGYINKNEYDLLIHESVDKRKKNIFNIILHFSLFRAISQSIFERKYLNYFRDIIFEINHCLFKEGDEVDYMYFINDGEYELSVNKNIIEVNNMIMKYKKILKKITKANEINNINLNIADEMKQNSNLIVNKNFRSDIANKIIFERKYIKLNILYAKDIIGLSDMYYLDKENEDQKLNNNDYGSDILNYRKNIRKKCLLNCKCLTYNCHTYCLTNNVFNILCYNGGSLNELIKNLEIKKICSTIERLKKHKKFIFDSISTQNILSTKIKTKKINTKSPKIYQKGIFEPNIYHNVMTEIKTSNEEKRKMNNIKLADNLKTLNNNCDDFINTRNNFNTIDSMSFRDKIYPMLSTTGKTDKLNTNLSFHYKTKKSKKINDINLTETIFGLFNKKKNNPSNNMSKIMIHDLLYENIFYNYTTNNHKNVQSQTNIIKNKNLKTLNLKKINTNNSTLNIKTNDTTQKDFIKTFSNHITSKTNEINKEKPTLNKDNSKNDSLYRTNTEVTNPNRINNKVFNLSIDGKFLDKNYKKTILNTITKIKKIKIRLTKPKSIKAYDPLAFDKFNNFFNINFRKQYLISNLNN